MKRAGWTALFAATAVSALAETKEETFTKRVLPLLQASIPAHKFEYAGNLEIRNTTGGGSIYLDRLYGFAQANPKQADAAIASYVARLAQVIAEADKPLDKTALRLAVRNAVSLKKSLEAMGGGPKAAYPRELAGDLMVVPVVDTPTTVKYVGERDLGGLGLSESEMVKAAEENLRRIQRPLMEVAKVPPKSGLGTIKEEYAASRLIFVSDWAALEKRVGGNLIVMAPAYDTVLYGGGSSKEAVDALRTLGLHIARSSQVPLSSGVLRFKGDHWELVK